MVFLAGPRQAGKTTFARDIIGKDFKNRIYFNWDIIKDKRVLIENPAFFENVDRVDSSKPLVILDEIHKYKTWKNYLKGIYDQFSNDYLFLITGSGRLELMQKGGDSLAGRYVEFHLFPFTIAELSASGTGFDEFIRDPLRGFDKGETARAGRLWESLDTLGGFPEPFLKGKKTFWQKWSQTYARQIIRDDIRSLSELHNIDTMETLFSLLPSRVGSPFSINNAAGDLQVAFETVKNWLNLFDLYYLTFRVNPWTRKIPRAILKEKKMYLFNYPLVNDPAARFENMAALELLRSVHSWSERGFGNYSLHYIRNKEKEEVDFLIANNNTPVLLVEAKMTQDALARSLADFQQVLGVPAVQLVNKEGILRYTKNGRHTILTVTAHRWLSALPW